MKKEDKTQQEMTLRQRMKMMIGNSKTYLLYKRVTTFIYMSSHIFTMVLILFIALVSKSIIALFYVVLIIPTFFKVNSAFN